MNRHIRFVVMFACMLSLSAFASAQTVDIFGATYTVHGPFDVSTGDANFLNGEPQYTGLGGMGLGFKSGATPAEDRLFICDETGADGENAAVLTGSNPFFRSHSMPLSTYLSKRP